MTSPQPGSAFVRSGAAAAAGSTLYLSTKKKQLESRLAVRLCAVKGMSCTAVLRAIRTLPWTSCPVRTLQLSSALGAGHNRWSKVKHIKGPKDAERSRMFMRFGVMIRLAVKEGGPNPDLNINLAQILEQCRAKNMPKASIDSAIKNATKPLTQYTFEARGPGACALVIEVLTDSHSRAQQEVKRLLSKFGGVLSDGARHNFNKRGVVVMPASDISLERALELAIEAGAEDVQETEDEEEKPLLQFICDTMAVRKVRAALEEMGMQITSSGLEYAPCMFSSLNQDQLEAAFKLVEALNDFPDVVRVWDNIHMDS